MPANHRFVHNLDDSWFQRQASQVGPHTSAYITALLKSRPYPQHAYRSCLGVLDLAHKHPQDRLETACQSLLEANLFSYRDLKSELERLAVANPPKSPLPAHKNVRGSHYYQ